MICVIVSLLPLGRRAGRWGLSFSRLWRGIGGGRQVNISVGQTCWANRGSGTAVQAVPSDRRHDIRSAVERGTWRRRAIVKGRVATVIELGGVEDGIEEGSQRGRGRGAKGVGEGEVAQRKGQGRLMLLLL